MDPRLAVILDDLVEIVHSNECGPPQQAPAHGQQQISQQQHSKSPFPIRAIWRPVDSGLTTIDPFFNLRSTGHRMAGTSQDQVF
jgi:hypothetical protein